MDTKTKNVVQSRHTQLQEAIQKAAAKTLEDWKSMFKYSIKFTFFLVFTLVPISGPAVFEVVFGTLSLVIP